jgi:hypothetical protein
MKKRKPEARALPPLEPHRRYPIPAASELLSQSRAKTYLDIRAGTLAVIKDGRRTYVPGTEIIRRSTLPAV